jgi:adenylate cyclase
MPEKKVRQLAAVMFTDIVGYTALMQADEAIAVKVRARHREVFQQQHEIHHGEIVQYYGDGSLSVFKSAIEAATCAIEIQRLLQEGDPVPLRIGLHMGDIVFDKTEVYGDGVNFASRIESMGVAGAILLSEKLNDELQNHVDISTSSMGHFELKNIAQPVEIFAITDSGITVPEPTELKGKQKMVSKTIAVLPFVNMSTSAENEYFSDGITEEIINALCKIKTLKVTSRTSSFFFKNKNIPIKEIVKELQVSAILEGSVRLAGNAVRITAQLIQAEEDFHFWSETWDRKLENIFEIQDEISLSIADKLREQFGHFEIQEQLVEKQTESIAAYEYALKAKFHFNKWGREDIEFAISLYEKALALDPTYTAIHIGLADCYGFMGSMGYLSFEESWGKAAQLIHEANVINDQLPEVYYQLGNLDFMTTCNFRGAFAHMAKAIELNPNYVEAQQFMSFFYIVSGQVEKSREHLEIALRIDPLSRDTLFFSGYFHYMIGDYSKALEQFDECLRQNPENMPVHVSKAYCLLMLGRYDDALHYFDEMPVEKVPPGNTVGLAALIYTLTGDTDNAEKSLAQLQIDAASPEGFNEHSYLFLVYAAAGENDLAFKWLDEALANNSPLLLFRFPDPLAASLHSDPRFAEYQKIIFGVGEVSKKPKQKKKLLGEADATDYSNRLLTYMTESQSHLDHNLSLRSLADQIEVHPNQLSWLLNESLGQNFSEFVNGYRVEAFKIAAKDPKNAALTIMAIAFDCGFNSKTVFNTYFKKETGLTPKQFLDQ